VDRWGNTLTVVDPRNAAYVTRYRYNDQNQVEQTTQPNVEVWNEDTTHGGAAPVSTAYYDNLGRVIATTDANNHTARRIYDTAGNLVEERRADASRWTYAYDTLGRQIQEGDGVGLATTKTYDKLDRLIKTQQNGYTVSNQQFATFTYDELGNRTSVGNALGETTRYVYDSRGRLIQQLTPLWSTVRKIGVGVK
jgi:YD repeat-containing protein